MLVLKFIVSACLAGVKCRYDGEDRKDEEIFRLVKKGKALPLCPEQLSGLPTPRKTSQIKYNSGRKKVFSNTGEDLSQFFLRGADLSFRMAKRFKIGSAYLRKGSPACGFGLEDRRKKTEGITSTLFIKKGMRIFPR